MDCPSSAVWRIAVAVGQLTNPPTMSPTRYSLPLPAIGSSPANMGVVGGVVGGFVFVAIAIFRCYREPQAPAPPRQGENAGVWVDRDPGKAALNNKI